MTIVVMSLDVISPYDIAPFGIATNLNAAIVIAADVLTSNVIAPDDMATAILTPCAITLDIYSDADFMPVPDVKTPSLMEPDIMS